MELIMANKPKTPAIDAMPVTYLNMLERALYTLKLLHAKCGIDYAVLSEKYGITEATIDLTKPAVKPKRTRVQSHLPYGTLTNYYMPFIENMQPDDLVQIPVGEFDWVALQSSITARGGQMWGKGRVTCVTSKDRTVLEVWRLPDGVEKSGLLMPHSSAGRDAASVDD
jgi:hypothetical protein